MLGRGTRIDEPTKKYKFWLYDYSGEGGDTGGGDDDSPPIIEIGGQTVHILPQGHFIPVSRDGRDVMISLEDYREEMIQRVLREAHTLEDFRALWVERENRLALIRHLRGEHYSPEVVQEALKECDLFDVFAHYGYQRAALKRWEREAVYLSGNSAWFASVNEKAAIVLRGIGHQFGVGGTDALESELLWEVPEIKRADGLDALKIIGKPIDVMREAKKRLFGV